MLPKAPNKYSINTIIKYYEHIQGSHFNLASVSKNSILTILKSTQVSKAAGLDSLSGWFLKDGAKFLAKPIIIYVISQLTLKNFLTVAK